MRNSVRSDKAISRADLNALTSSLRCVDGAKCLTIGTGKIANPTLMARLQNAVDTGKSFFGGQVRSGTPIGADDFYIFFPKL